MMTDDEIRTHLDHDWGYREKAWSHHKAYWEERENPGGDLEIAIEVGKSIDWDPILAEIYCYTCKVVLISASDPEWDERVTFSG